MIALLITVIQFLVVGMAAARWLDPSMPPRRLLGSAFLIGSGICAFVLLALSVLGIRWTPLSFTVAFCVVAIGSWVPLLRRRDGRPEGRPASRDPIALAFDAGTLLLVIAHGAYALKVGEREWDFFAIWGLKARVFFVHGGIDWAYLAHPDHAFIHPDYPPLLPLNHVQIALMNGQWLGSASALLSTLYAAALLLIVRDFFAGEFSRPAVAAAATLAVASGAFSQVGPADAPMIAYGAAGLLMIRNESFHAGAVLLGLAAFTKNEGLALLVAAAIALLLTPRRSAIARLWPAAAIAAPWLILRTMHTFRSDLAEGGLLERAANAVARVPELARALADRPPYTPLFWIAIAVALIASARRLDRERFLLAAVFLQLGFYLVAYLTTPYDLWLHVQGSWARILPHVAVPVAFAAVTLVMEERRASTSP